MIWQYVIVCGFVPLVVGTVMIGHKLEENKQKRNERRDKN
jgi:hypothetical protein